MTDQTSLSPLFELQDVEKRYQQTGGAFGGSSETVHALNGVSIDIRSGEALGIVGESGCGKSTLARCLLGLERPTMGSISYRGTDLQSLPNTERRRFRREVQIVFQDPHDSFDPRMTVGESIEEPLRIHGLRDRSHCRSIISNLLERVGLSAADRHRYPHEFSGGQKQRIALARALALNPSVLVADEPVAALDVSVQAEILSLVSELQRSFGLTLVVISHDLRVIEAITDRIAVMYLGRVVEVGPTADLLGDPQHPYTEGLVDAIPIPDPRRRSDRRSIDSSVPRGTATPQGCCFHSRCPAVIPPAELDVDQETWRAVFTICYRLRERTIDISDLRRRVGGDASREQLHDVIREQHTLADRLADPAAERALSTAIDRYLVGDFDQCDAILTDEFASVCQQFEPLVHDIGPDHTARCHRHDPSQPGPLEPDPVTDVYDLDRFR